MNTGMSITVGYDAALAMAAIVLIIIGVLLAARVGSEGDQQPEEPTDAAPVEPTWTYDASQFDDEDDGQVNPYKPSRLPAATATSPATTRGSSRTFWGLLFLVIAIVVWVLLLLPAVRT